jgi:hypothetical protein
LKAVINNGGPAFPVREEDGQGGYEQHKGMDLRDYFAGKALQGICAAGPSEHWTDKHITAETYRLADAMLKAREDANT